MLLYPELDLDPRENFSSDEEDAYEFREINRRGDEWPAESESE